MLPDDTKTIRCPDCGAEIEITDRETIFKCERCGREIRLDEYLEDAAKEIRSAGLEKLASRFMAAAEQVREVEG